MSTNSPKTTTSLMDTPSITSVSGPHSIMEIDMDRDKKDVPTDVKLKSAKIPPQNDSTFVETNHFQDSSNIMNLNPKELQDDDFSKDDDNCVAADPCSAENKRPPMLEMVQDPSLTGVSDGPKTPVSPRARSATLKAGDREKKIGHRRVGEGGVTYKKIHTSQIMGSIQLGISHAVGGLASKPERDLLMQDFMTIETTNFYSQGSQLTPAHHYSDFRFKSFAPIAFRYFRDLFGIQPDDFLLSLCNEPLRELTNPGASGSIFYLSADDEFIIKTVQHKEGEFLMKLLLGYYMNLNQNPRTLLPKFFGLYCYQCNSKNVRMVVMNNLLPSSIKLHEKYDLKGSTYKRKASKAERSKSVPTYKDLDFLEIHPDGIMLEADTYTALIKTIQRDCRVLESFKIMDYSLLVAVHNLDVAAREEAERRHNNSTGDEESGDENAAGASTSAGPSAASACAPPTHLVRSRSINRQKLVAHSTALESIQAESEPIDEEDDVPPGGIPARNAKGERLLLFLGIIDILQSYRLKKKLEHTLKAMIHDGDTVSVHRPGFYSQRFQNFMAKQVFRKVPSLDLPEFKGKHRKFRNLVSSYIALKHSPSKKKLAVRTRATSAADGGAAAYPEDGFTASQESAADDPEVILGSPAVEVGGGHTVTFAIGTTSGSDSEIASTSFGSHIAGSGNGYGSITTSAHSQPVNLPAVLKDRMPSNLRPGTGSSSRGPPPPVPPRSPKRVNTAASTPAVSSTGQAKVSFRPPRGSEDVGELRSVPSTPSSSSTPPPAFDDVLRSGPSDKTRYDPRSTESATSFSPLRIGDKQKQPASSSSDIVNRLDSQMEAISMSEVQLEVRSDSKASSLGSAEMSRRKMGGSSAATPTPTWTEGTPSFTESSSSGELAFSSSPAKSNPAVSNKGGRARTRAAAEGESKANSSPVPSDHEMTHL